MKYLFLIVIFVIISGCAQELETFDTYDEVLESLDLSEENIAYVHESNGEELVVFHREHNGIGFSVINEIDNNGYQSKTHSPSVSFDTTRDSMNWTTVTVDGFDETFKVVAGNYPRGSERVEVSSESEEGDAMVSKGMFFYIFNNSDADNIDVENID